MARLSDSPAPHAWASTSGRSSCNEPEANARSRSGVMPSPVMEHIRIRHHIVWSDRSRGRPPRSFGRKDGETQCGATADPTVSATFRNRRPALALRGRLPGGDLSRLAARGVRPGSLCAAVRGQRRRSIKMTRTMMIIRTTVPMPIYMAFPSSDDACSCRCLGATAQHGPA